MRIRKKDPANETLPNEEILTLAKVSDALAHPARVQMLCFILNENLARRPVTNKDIVKAFDYAQATVSQHLSKLIIGELLEMKKRGTSSSYFARIDRLSAYIELLKKINPTRETDEIPDFLRSGFFSGGKNTGGIGDDLSMNYYDDMEEEIQEF